MSEQSRQASPGAKPVVLVAEGSDPAPLAWLAERAEVLQAGAGDASFWDGLGRADGLLVRTYTQVDEALLKRAPRLKVVGRAGVGIENIDVSACRRRGIKVVHTPDANTIAVGDFVFGVLIRMVRDWSYITDVAPTPGQFRKTRDALRGRQLDELTLGVLGMGRVGRRVGHIAALGFGMRVIYNDLLDVSALLDFPAEAVSKEELYSRSDVLTIHVDMRPGNERLVAAPALARLPAGAIVINTSRGQVLDAPALRDALVSGKVSAAAVDVFDPEPPPPDHPLLGLPNALLTPHIASRTTKAVQNMGWVVRDMIEVLQGRTPRHSAP